MSNFDLAEITPDDKFLLNVKTILQYYVGEDSRIDKATLAHRLRTSERKIRAAVSELQRRGELIITDTDQGDYYYLGTNTEPAERYINQERHRAFQILEKANALSDALKSRRGVDAGQGRLC